MIYCINQPLEKYNVTVGGMEMGLYNSYKDRPALMAAMFLMTHTPFEYEETSTIPETLRACVLREDIEGLLSDTLISCVGNKMVLTLLEFLNPLEFYEFLEGFDLSHLPIRKFYSSDENMRIIIRARVGAWLESLDQTYVDSHLHTSMVCYQSKQQVIEAVNGGN